jgi:4-hydroxyphenylpyruvate dioxygenase
MADVLDLTLHSKETVLNSPSSSSAQLDLFVAGEAVPITPANPMGTDGFEFIEYTALDVAPLAALFKSLGFVAIARHRSKSATLYRQGDINFIVNAEPGSFAQSFARAHGPSACAMAFRVADAAAAYRRALSLGAKPFQGDLEALDPSIPAIEGIGGSLLYFVDRYGARGSIYDADFVPLPGVDQSPKGVGLTYLDHLTHNVYRGRIPHWAGFYETLFNFREVHQYDIEGKHTGLKLKAMTSPCGKIRIPINEASGDKSQIQEYLDRYKGEGIQHIALGSDDIYASVEALKARQMKFMDTLATYFETVDARVPGHGENLRRLQENGILIDGAPTQDRGLLLQIFTDTVIGPIFFEIIQRKGNEGFGEGNIKALFESVELDQIRRGVLAAE